LSSPSQLHDKLVIRFGNPGRDGRILFIALRIVVNEIGSVFCPMKDFGTSN
jgi:hypothetical protein